MKQVAILEGWAGGSKLHIRFTDLLEKEGFGITKNAQDADIIFAHSTGCYRIPGNTKASQIILLDPPYWPGRHIFARMMRKKSSDALHTTSKSEVLKKTFWEAIYIAAKPTYTTIALKNHKSLDFLDRLGDKEALIIRNKDDAFCSPAIEGRIEHLSGISFKELPGGHDDFKTNPKPYVDLIKKA